MHRLAFDLAWAGNALNASSATATVKVFIALFSLPCPVAEPTLQSDRGTWMGCGASRGRPPQLFDGRTREIDAIAAILTGTG